MNDVDISSKDNDNASQQRGDEGCEIGQGNHGRGRRQTQLNMTQSFLGLHMVYYLSSADSSNRIVV